MMSLSKQVVLDTSVLVGLIDSRDIWHNAAVALRDALKVVQVKTVYFDCVINEAISVLARRAKERKHSFEFTDLLAQLVSQVPEDSIIWISAETRRFYPEIIALVRDTSGALNFHDALIALGCRELGIQLIATFDKDFDHTFYLPLSTCPSPIRRFMIRMNKRLRSYSGGGR